MWSDPLVVPLQMEMFSLINEHICFRITKAFFDIGSLAAVHRIDLGCDVISKVFDKPIKLAVCSSWQTSRGASLEKTLTWMYIFKFMDSIWVVFCCGFKALFSIMSNQNSSQKRNNRRNLGARVFIDHPFNFVIVWRDFFSSIPFEKCHKHWTLSKLALESSWLVITAHFAVNGYSILQSLCVFFSLSFFCFICIGVVKPLVINTFVGRDYFTRVFLVAENGAFSKWNSTECSHSAALMENPDET